MGTTVRVERFLQTLPVRRQAAQKTSVKTLAKVKRILQAYALARPHLRLSLRILKAKDRKGDWTYTKSGALSASRLEASFNAAANIFGKKLTSQCDSTASSWSSTGEQIDEAASERLGPSTSINEAYTLEATMAKRDCGRYFLRVFRKHKVHLLISSLDGSVLSNVGHFLSVDSRLVSCTRGTLKHIISSYKSHLRSAISSEENTKIVDPFLCLNIVCPPGSYDANVEPAKDDVLFAESELLLEIVERWFHSIYGKVQTKSSKSSAKTASASKPRGVELLLARREVSTESAHIDFSPVVGSTQFQLRSSPLATPTFDSSVAAPPCSQNNAEISGAISNPFTEPTATDGTQAEASPGLLPSHDRSTHISSEGIGLEPSNADVPARCNRIWKGSMYAEEEDEEEDLEFHHQGRPRSPVDHDLDGEEHLRDVNVSNPWSFARLNAAIRPSGQEKQLHTPGRQSGEVGRSTDPPPDDLPESVDSSLPEKPLPRVHQARSSPEAAYPTPGPFPFPQKARGKRKAGDASGDMLVTPVPSNKKPYKLGALDTWVQKSLGNYNRLDEPPNTPEHRGPPDLPYARDFISARSLPQNGTPLSEIPDASQRPRRKPAARKQQQDRIHKPFISPVNDPNRVWFDTGENPSHKRPQLPRPNKDHQYSAEAPTLILRDNEVEDEGSVVSALAETSTLPIHPDLAITLDYEARKQKASEAHKQVLREQAAAARLINKAQADVPDPLHPQHTTTSPHKNRRAKAIAALHTSNIPSTSPGVDETSIFEPSDPRAYLLRVRQQGEEAPEPPRGKSKRQKTAMLPLETVKEELYIGDLTLIVEDVNVGDVEEDMQESGAWDDYVKAGKAGEAFEKVDVEVPRWEEKLRALVGGMYAVEGEEGESADLDLNLSNILQAHAAGFA